MSAHLKVFFLALVTGVLLAGCATGEPPTTLLSEAEQKVEQAHSLGAEQYAPMAYEVASDQLKQAKAAMEKEKYEDAKLDLEKSLVNSELAIAQINSEKSQEAASQIRKNLDTLREETLQSNY